MPLLILAMAATLAAGADASPAQPPLIKPDVAVTAQSTKPTRDPNKVVCHSEEVTGSRFTQRICRTNSQWDSAERAADNYKREIEDRNGLQTKASGPFGN